MSRICQLTGKGALSGNNISHSQRKTPRSFKVNLQKVSLNSEILRKKVNVRIAISTLRTVDFKGGLDSFLLNTKNHKLTDYAKKIKRQIKKKQSAEK